MSLGRTVMYNADSVVRLPCNSLFEARSGARHRLKRLRRTGKHDECVHTPQRFLPTTRSLCQTTCLNCARELTQRDRTKTSPTPRFPSRLGQLRPYQRRHSFLFVPVVLQAWASYPIPLRSLRSGWSKCRIELGMCVCMCVFTSAVTLCCSTRSIRRAFEVSV